ncbi:hypothetical protein KU6B_56820 (plasmid) [Mameliella alba]|uniref:GlcG/HbpS family heme-binding protein n=1 Tax=Mameliella alba TaxID=561184 RepID=UPI0013E514FF|nr:heme-binding protein [Mameliella alba]BBU59417.1 hypothetical protein KU6B_56820 [Mameliella alba]
MTIKVNIAAILGATLLSANGAVALETAPVLDMDTALKIAGGCQARAEAEGWRMNIAIVDRGANLIVFQRMDDAFLGSGDIAIGKAQTSANFPFSTRLVGDLAYGVDGAAPGVQGLDEVEGVIAFAGGLPIRAGEFHIGGIGVSGDSADNDEACAKAGLEAVFTEMK